MCPSQVQRIKEKPTNKKDRFKVVKKICIRKLNTENLPIKEDMHEVRNEEVDGLQRSILEKEVCDEDIVNDELFVDELLEFNQDSNNAGNGDDFTKVNIEGSTSVAEGESVEANEATNVHINEDLEQNREDLEVPNTGGARGVGEEYNVRHSTEGEPSRDPQIEGNMEQPLNEGENDSAFDSDESCDEDKRVQNKLKRAMAFREDNLANPQLSIGMIFPNIALLRRALVEFAIRNHFDLVYVRNERKKVIVKCKVKDCLWRVYAKCKNNSVGMRIRIMNDQHKCYAFQDNGEKTASHNWVAEKILSKMIGKEKPRLSTIHQTFQEEYDLSLNYHKLWRGTKKAIDKVFGSFDKSYELIPSYCMTLMRCNPGSIVEYSVTTDGLFESMFVSLNAFKEAFHWGCRPFIG